jgi:nicotinamidase-related amidase
VGLGLPEGYPETPAFDTPFLRLKQSNLFEKGSPSAEFDSSIFRPGDLVIYKHRFGAFSKNHLDLVLRSRDIENLVRFGISTSRHRALDGDASVRSGLPDHRHQRRLL